MQSGVSSCSKAFPCTQCPDFWELQQVIIFYSPNCYLKILILLPNWYCCLQIHVTGNPTRITVQYVIGYWGSGYLSRAHVTRVWLRHVAISFLIVEHSRPFWSHYKGNRYPKAAEEDLDRKVVRLRRNHNVHSIPKNEFWDRPMKLWHKVIFTKSSIPTNL